MIITFCGHGDLGISDEVKKWLYEVVEKTIKDGATTFYLGGYGHFDFLAGVVVTELKEKYPHIQRVLVIPYLDRDYDMKHYDSSYYPSLENVPKRFAISKRNQAMVNEADVVISYVVHSWGGAAKTLEYAQKKKKTILNYPETQA